MDVDHLNKPEELGEEDLVDYEEEDEPSHAPEKPVENGKDSSKKYAEHCLLYAIPFS